MIASASRERTRRQWIAVACGLIMTAMGVSVIADVSDGRLDAPTQNAWVLSWPVQVQATVAGVCTFFFGAGTLWLLYVLLVRRGERE